VKRQVAGAASGPSAHRGRVGLILTKSSYVISRIAEYDPSRLMAFPYMRESTLHQVNTGNLINRLSSLRRYLDKLGIECSNESFTEQGYAKSLNRPVFKNAIRLARQYQSSHPGRRVVVVTDTRDRFLRGSDCDRRTGTDIVLPEQLQNLWDMTTSVLLATRIHPDATTKEIKRYEVKVAGAAGKQLGRPPKKTLENCESGWKKRRREKLLPIMLENIVVAGCSKRECGRRLGVPESTIRAWLKRPEIR
jgi:DNA invertase Pin-like site-specific DNA recombinase